MDRIQYFREQAARAERLARSVMDAVTVERLVEASREYRQLADRLEGSPEHDFASTPAASWH